jgi:hypothetical protein
MSHRSKPSAGEGNSGSTKPNLDQEAEVAEYRNTVENGIVPYGTGKHSLPQHAILHHLRGCVESYHRCQLAGLSTHPYHVYRPHLDIDGSEGYLPMTSILDQDADCCNRTAPFYILSDYQVEDQGIFLFLMKLHNWLYKTWFRPYESEIDYGQFIAKTICPKPIPSLNGHPEAIFGKIIKLNNRICRQVEEYRNQLAHPDPKKIPEWMFSELQPNEQELFLLRPTFRAVIIVLDPNDYDLLSSNDLGDTTAYIIRTGITEGLSAPVSFDLIPNEAILGYSYPPHHEPWLAVKTSLMTAYKFLMSLEAREVEAFGMQPDPAKFPTLGRLQQRTLSMLDKGKREKWEGDALRLGGLKDPTLRMPSSKWVDLSLYKDWFGYGEDNHNRIMKWHEERLEKQYRKMLGKLAREDDNGSDKI